MNFFETNFPSTSSSYQQISKFQSYKSGSNLRNQDIDDYFNMFASQQGLLKSSLSVDSLNNYKPYFHESRQSINSDRFRAIQRISDMECETCKNLILKRGNRRCSLCGDCIDKLYSPKICSICKGRISFIDLKNSTSIIDKNFKKCEDFMSMKLCNCFPKYPSQHLSSIQPNIPNQIQILPGFNGKSCSFEDIILSRQQFSSRRNSALFSSHISLRNISVFEEDHENSS